MSTPVSGPAMHAEAYHDRLEGSHALDVDRFSTAHERAGARAFVAGVSYGCSSCGQHRFPTADVVCFWCRNGRRKR